MKVTGVDLDLAMVNDSAGKPLLVPAYSFKLDGGGNLPLVAAVVDNLLEQPAGGSAKTP
jgi:hypothetical protein